METIMSSELKNKLADMLGDSMQNTVLKVQPAPIEVEATPVTSQGVDTEALEEKRLRVTAEVTRLTAACEAVKIDLSIVNTLIQRCAKLLIFVEDLEEDLLLHGTTEFIATKDGAVEKERAAAKQLTTFQSNYNKLMNSIINCIPKEAKNPLDNEQKAGLEQLKAFMSSRPK